jgi:coupling of ubiquitin conjugation to ER degradation protein 1
MSEIQTNFTLPQLVVVLVIGFLVIRWIFFSSSSSNQTAGSHAAGRSRVSQAQVEQVAQMFPQFGAREIMWDLQRNGGNVQATTERVLSGRGLDMVCLDSASSPSLERDN